ncbi:MAG: hypothetical protein M1281_14880 [Chloroflexi bacterium]|nr:hypothetical protein [Chloroflexota bacterium]
MRGQGLPQDWFRYHVYSYVLGAWIEQITEDHENDARQVFNELVRRGDRVLLTKQSVTYEVIAEKTGDHRRPVQYDRYRYPHRKS